MATIRVIKITDSDHGIVTELVAEVETQRKALQLAKRAAGRCAEFFARGEDQYRQIGYVGPDGTVTVA